MDSMLKAKSAIADTRKGKTYEYKSTIVHIALKTEAIQIAQHAAYLFPPFIVLERILS
jgi:hypothetical protein